MAQLYESIFILRPSLADDDIHKTLDKVKSTVQKAGEPSNISKIGARRSSRMK